MCTVIIAVTVIFMTVFTWIAWDVYFSLYKNDCPVTVAPLAFAVKDSSILVAEKNPSIASAASNLLLLLLLHLALAFN